MYTIDPTCDEPIMMLDRHIGFDEEDGQGIDGAAFARELLQLDTMGKKSIKMVINCPGGNIMDGMNIYNAMLMSKTPVDTVNAGIAASMGAVCFMAGRKREMNDYASMMVHNPSGSEDKKAFTAMREGICTMLAAKSNLTPELVGELMDATSWINSSECFSKGFCTSVVATSDSNMKHMPKKDAVAMWKFGAELVNNIFKTENNNMKKITARLKLQEGSTEDVILEAIELMANKSTTLQAAHDAAVLEVTSAKNKTKIAEDALKALQDKMAADATTAAETAATAMVTNFAKVGRIKNDVKTIASWTALAVVDLAGTKAMIEDLPLSKSAPPKADVVDNTDAAKSLGTAAGVMIAIHNRTKATK